MTQLALLLALSLIGVVSAFGFGRFEVRRGAVAPTVKRAEGALERAALAVVQLGALRALPLLGIPALGLSLFAFFGGAHGSVSDLGRAAFLVIALLAGAASALLQARLALLLGARAASSAAAAVARGSARAMRPLLRAAAAIAVFGEGLGLLGLAGAFAGLYAVRGGFAGAHESGALAAEVVRLLPAFALGAAVTALSVSRAGCVAASAARVGASHANELDASLELGAARDPALLAELVGYLVGELLPRTLTGYVCGLTATVSAGLLASSGLSGTAAPFGGGTAWLELLVLVRSFGAIGSVCGVFAARVTDDEPPARALWRGQASGIVVGLFGLGAALFWLEREHCLPLFAAGALGLLAMATVGPLSWLPLRRAQRSARDLQDSRAGDAATLVRGASSGLSSLWPSLLVPALLLAVAERALSPLVPAGLLLLTFAAGALALTPLSMSMAGFGLLATHTRGLATLTRLEQPPTRRSSKLDDAGTFGGAAGSTHASLALAISLLLGLWSLSNALPATQTSSLGLAVFATAFGIALVLVFGARATRSAASGAKLVASEVERQLRELVRQPGGSVPADFTPSYKACVEAAFTAARGASVLEVAALLLAPFLLAVPAHWAGGPALLPLLGFGAASVVAGLVFTLGGRATRAMLGELRRRLRGGDSGPDPVTATQADSFGELVGVTGASSVEALALVLALSVLCLAPLLR